MTIANEGAYYTGKYRNLFKEAGYSEEAITAKLEQAWFGLFEGDPDVRIYYPMGDDKGYMLDTGNLDVRSEGMSYGMMMAVQMNKKEIFDRLWNYAITFMQHSEGRYKHYFAWHCKPDGTRISQGPAPDGEEFFAMALFFCVQSLGRRRRAVQLFRSGQSDSACMRASGRGRRGRSDVGPGNEADQIYTGVALQRSVLPSAPFL